MHGVNVHEARKARATRAQRGVIARRGGGGEGGVFLGGGRGGRDLLVGVPCQSVITRAIVAPVQLARYTKRRLRLP